MGTMLPRGTSGGRGSERVTHTPSPTSGPNGVGKTPGSSPSVIESPSSTAVPSILDTPSPEQATRRLVPTDDMQPTNDPVVEGGDRAQDQVNNVNGRAIELDNPTRVRLPNNIEGDPSELARGPRAMDAVRAAIPVLFERAGLATNHDEETSDTRVKLATRIRMIGNGLSQHAGSDARLVAENMAETLIREAGNLATPDNGSTSSTSANNTAAPIADSRRERANGKPDDSVDPAERMKAGIEIINASYPPEVAEKLRGVLENYGGLTDAELRNRCNDATEDVDTAVGFDIEFGTFRLDTETPPEEDSLLYHPHAWSVDPQGRKLDLTLRQFNRFLDPSNRVDSHTVVIDETHPLWERYQPIHDY